MMPPLPDPDRDLSVGDLGCTFDELLEALATGGAEVERGIIVDGEFIVQAND